MALILVYNLRGTIEMTAGEQKAVASGQWTISDNGQQQGPYSAEQMKQMIREGRMPPGALVWTPGMTEWKAWRQVPEFELLGGAGGWTDRWRQPSKGQIVDYLVFRRMILPLVMQVVFWLGVLALVLGFLDLLRMAWKAADGFGESLFVLFAMGLGLIVFSLLWRCVCECVILFYRINETLTDVKDSIERQGR